MSASKDRMDTNDDSEGDVLLIGSVPPPIGGGGVCVCVCDGGKSVVEVEFDVVDVGGVLSGF